MKYSSYTKDQLEIKNLKVQFIDHLFEYKTLKENELPF